MKLVLRREFRQRRFDRDRERIVFFNEKNVTFNGLGRWRRHRSLAERILTYGAQVVCLESLIGLSRAPQLFVTQGLDGIERRSTICRVKSEPDPNSRANDEAGNGPAIGENYVDLQPHSEQIAAQYS